MALTGGVGSGKSTAAAMLRDLGAQVSQSDEVSRALMQPGQSVYAATCQHFGDAVLSPTGELDRAALARIAFQQGRVEELNAIVHPAVIAAQSRWMESIGERNPYAVAVVESALVFETKYRPEVQTPGSIAAVPWHTLFDRIVVVTAPPELRRNRYIQRATRLSADVASADFEARAAAQWSDQQKAALADFVLENDGSLKTLELKVRKIYSELQAEASDSAGGAM